MEDNESPRDEAPRRISRRTVEIIVAVFVLVLGLIVVFDSRRIGAAWAEDGPQAGYFPFYVGLLICLSSAWILLHALFSKNGSNAATFATAAEWKPVLAMLLPSVAFVGAIYLLGLYLAAVIFIAAFMLWKGSFGVVTSALVSVTVSVLLFLTFELWFLVPLPKRASCAGRTTPIG